MVSGDAFHKIRTNETNKSLITLIYFLYTQIPVTFPVADQHSFSSYCPLYILIFKFQWVSPHFQQILSTKHGPYMFRLPSLLNFVGRRGGTVFYIKRCLFRQQYKQNHSHDGVEPAIYYIQALFIIRPYSDTQVISHDFGLYCRHL